MSAQQIIPRVLEMFPEISSVVDFGCGTGAWLSVFKQCGIDSVKGIDGGASDNKSRLIGASEYQHANFISDTLTDVRADLAMSLEVAEHFDEQYAHGFVKNLCNASDLILFSAAIPEQGGINHVNERWPSYWQDIFSAHNYQLYDVIRSHIWLDERIEWWYRQNIFVIVNRSNQDLMARLQSLLAEQTPILNLVHPENFLYAHKQANKLANEHEKLQKAHAERSTTARQSILRRLKNLLSGSRA